MTDLSLTSLPQLVHLLFQYAFTWYKFKNRPIINCAPHNLESSAPCSAENVVWINEINNLLEPLVDKTSFFLCGDSKKLHTVLCVCGVTYSTLSTNTPVKLQKLLPHILLFTSAGGLHAKPSQTQHGAQVLGPL